MKRKSLTYITYQTFPADTANSIQTISNIKYLIKNGLNVKLYFPLREETSDSNIDELKKFYSIDEEFESVGLKHNLPFGKLKFLESIWFHISHFLWSRKNVKKIIKLSNSDETFFTRSDWVLYFLSRQEKNIIFECHQVSKVRSWVLKRISKNKKVKVIFLNKNLQTYYKSLNLNNKVLHNGVDSILFSKFINMKKNENQVIYVGNLLRFGKKRDLDFIIEAFSSFEELKDFNLQIIGGPEKEATRLRELTKENKFQNITITGRLDKEETAKKIMESSFGILINSGESLHSKEFTSPLKYFEYLFAKLNIVAVDFPAHRILPYSENISFFKHGDHKEFINCIIESSSKNNINNFKEISIDDRIKELLKFIENK